MIKQLMNFLLILGLTFYSKTSAAQNHVAVKPIQHQVPVLTRKTNNPTLQLELVNPTHKEADIQAVTISLNGTTRMSDIKAVRLFVSKKEGSFPTEKQFGKESIPATEMVFEDHLPFDDTAYLWVSVELKEHADLTGVLHVRCKGVRINSRPVKLEESKELKPLRLGTAVRQNGEDNVHTYRIPGITTTNNGTLLAIYDVRRDNRKDLQGNIDIGMSRSTDGGKTWEPMKIVLDMGTWGGLPQKFNGVSDANILVDRTNNQIFVFGLWMHGVLDKDGRFIEGLTEESDAWEHQWKNKGSQPGLGVKETSQVIYTVSKDDGKTWSEPVNVTSMFKKKEWWLGTVAPGHGITLRDGTLVLPTQGRDKNGFPFSNITWSRDGGKTWTAGKPACYNTTENMVVQLSDGSLMSNMRHNENRNNATTNGRAVAVTHDLGETWTEHPTSRKVLTEPTCMASLHKHEYTENGKSKSILLFSNPNSYTNRRDLTIKVSFDEGQTWPEEYWTLLDEKNSMYSCLTSVDEQTIGILYEGSQASMTFQKISLATLLQKNKEKKTVLALGDKK